MEAEQFATCSMCSLAPAPNAGSAPCLSIEALPIALQEEIWLRLGLHDLARAATVCRLFAALSRRRLESKTAISAAADLPLLSRQHNYLLLGGGAREGGSAAADRQRRRILGYIPAALHYASRCCRALQRLHLELPPPQTPLSGAADAVAQAVAGEPWQAPAPLAALAAAAADVGCPPVDGYIIKLLAQCCPELRSLRLVNLSNNADMNRLVRLNDSCLAILARSCPQLEELVLGHRGGEECVFNPASSFYLEDVTDAGMRALAAHSSRLKRLGLLRCSRVGDEGIAAIAEACRQLTALLLHDCPGISERALLRVGERCSQLRALDCTVARRGSGLLMMGEEGEQLGFRALFTIAANCPLLEEVCVSEEGLEAPVVDDDCIICLAQGCPGLRRLVLRHCSAVTDTAARAVATRCKLLQELSLEHTAVGDAGVLALARGLPALRSLSLTNYISSLGHLAFLPGGGPRPPRGVSDAALLAIADHCTALRHLAVTGSRRVTDAGLRHLAHRPTAVASPQALALRRLVGQGQGQGHASLPRHPALPQQLTSLTINHTAATDGAVCELLQRCGELRALSLRGLLYNADSTAAVVARACRHLTSLDLRYCSTLSDSGLAEVSRLPFLRSLHLSFCVRITDAGLCQLAGAAAAAHPAPRASRRGSTSAGNSAAVGLYRSVTTQEWHGSSARWAVHRTASSGDAQAAPFWDCAAEAAAIEQGTRSAGKVDACVPRRSMLREVELYHVPQVTHRGIRALVEACPGIKHVNIGKCRLVKVEGLQALLCARGVRLSACHYLDSA